MTNFKRWLLIITAGSLALVLLLGAVTVLPALAQSPIGRGMMGGWGFNQGQPGGYGPGWMMGRSQAYTGTNPSGYGPGWMYGGPGHMGMMGGWGNPGGNGYGGGMMGGGMMHGGMMGGGMFSGNSPFFTTDPLTVEETATAVKSYLATLNDSNLALKEVMIFDNHAYAEVVEKDTGIGAMELLVDPQTRAVQPEMGPNMMWNLKYGMMAGYGGSWRNGAPAQEASAEMNVAPAQAVEAAQTYLANNFNSTFTADEHADPFYGYYTLHVNQNGQTVGMLSVNGFSGQVFLHTWHGKLLEMSETEH